MHAGHCDAGMLLIVNVAGGESVPALVPSGAAPTVPAGMHPEM